MGDITKITAIKTTTVIWEYDSNLPDNYMLGGNMIIAAIHTMAIKVCWVHLRDLAFKF